MPQFDPSSYASQIFWLLVIFAIFYWLMARVAIPRIAEVIQARSERVASDLDKAEQLKKESQAVIETYETALSKAREEAASVLVDTAQEISAMSSERQAAYAAELAARITEAEDSIAKAMTKAKSEIRTIAIEAAGETTRKLIGVEPQEQRVAAAVDTILKDAS